jgi:hypothetical protein
MSRAIEYVRTRAIVPIPQAEFPARWEALLPDILASVGGTWS